MIFIDKARRKQCTLKVEKGQWSYISPQLEEKKFEPKINEILVSKQLAGETNFELFLKYYVLDFENMKQINVETKFPRTIKKMPLTDNTKDTFKW